MRMLRSKLIEIKEREHLDKISDIKGAQLKIEWGSQIRNYVFMPYTLVKDTRTGYETSNVNAVMDGDARWLHQRLSDLSCHKYMGHKELIFAENSKYLLAFTSEL